MYLDLDKDDSLADDVFALVERAHGEGRFAAASVLSCLFCCLHDGTTRRMAEAIRPIAEDKLLRAATDDGVIS